LLNFAPVSRLESLVNERLNHLDDEDENVEDENVEDEDEEKANEPARFAEEKEEMVDSRNDLPDLNAQLEALSINATAQRRVIDDESEEQCGECGWELDRPGEERCGWCNFRRYRQIDSIDYEESSNEVWIGDTDEEESSDDSDEEELSLPSKRRASASDDEGAGRLVYSPRKRAARGREVT
jgi:hypothetical protein